jgi:hypothetical protein
MDTQASTASAPVSDPSPSSITNWDQFAKAKLTPIEIICSEYRPVHTSVTGCHTRLQTKIAKVGAPLNPRTKRPLKTGTGVPMLDHVKHGHGGGFLMKFKKGGLEDKVAWAGWEDLKRSGVEVTDIRCEWCEKAEDRIHAGSLLSHFRSHKGRGRGMRAADSFWVTLSFAQVDPETIDPEDDE